jgi:hypothetical protein
MKVLFISSLERSGSTILELKLGSHANVIGFGEVWRVIKPHGAGLDSVRERRCTCGETGKTCQFWSRVFMRIKETAAETLEQRYEAFFDVVKQRYGDDVVVVDSSKSMQSLEAVAGVPDVDIYVLFTVRDVRGWMGSITKAAARKKEMPWRKVFDADFKYFFWAFIRLNVLRLIPFWLPNEWLLRNLRILKKIRTTRLRNIQISYEALVFDSEDTMARIEEFLELTDKRQDAIAGTDSFHIIRGNRTAFLTDPKAPLYYDAQWMSAWKASVVISLLPWVAWYNRKWVYEFLDRKAAVD